MAKWEIYCNPGSYENFLRCTAEKHGCSPELVDEIYNRTKAGPDASLEERYQGTVRAMKEFESRGYGDAKKYCHVCEARANS